MGKWRTSTNDHDARIAKRLRKLCMRVYKYAAKHGLWHVDITVLNNGPEDIWDSAEEDGCYVAVRAQRYDATIVDDYKFVPIIEEPKHW